MPVPPDLVDILPVTATVNDDDHLVVAGVDVAAIAADFGTPVYVYDEETIRAACRAYTAAFMTNAGPHRVHYAAKAYLAPWLCHIIREEGLGLDVVSAGELHIALTAGFPAATMRLHGNNKLPGELRDAVAAGVGRIVVDNHDELHLLAEIAATAGRHVPILLRLSPGVETHTHEYLKTGLLDSKFGLPIGRGALSGSAGAATGDSADGDQALAAVRFALASPGLDLQGYHAHVGTGLRDPEPVVAGLRRLVLFARAARTATGYWPSEISPGSGLAIATVRGEKVPSVHAFASALLAVMAGVETAPALSVEPGRSIVGRAGIALYTAGARKTVPGMRAYIAVDGGMADNIRPALYGAAYTALAASRMTEPAAGPVTIAGRYCEAGDILVRDAPLPAMRPGDLLAIPAAGAYCLAMSSAYNAAPRPAVVVVHQGTARLVQRRGATADLLAYDVAMGTDD